MQSCSTLGLLPSMEFDCSNSVQVCRSSKTVHIIVILTIINRNVRQRALLGQNAGPTNPATCFMQWPSSCPGRPINRRTQKPRLFLMLPPSTGFWKTAASEYGNSLESPSVVASVELSFHCKQHGGRVWT